MDTNLDDKIRAVESVFKNDGFVWIVKFWQAAYKTNTGEVSLDGYHGVIHAENSRVTTEKQSEILKLCLEIGLLYKTGSGGYTSNGIQKRIKHIMAERERWRNKEENELSPEIIPEITPEIRGEIKLNETKGKEIRKENKDGARTATDPRFHFFMKSFSDYWKANKSGEPPITGKDGAQLKALLSRQHGVDADGFTAILAKADSIPFHSKNFSLSYICSKYEIILNSKEDKDGTGRGYSSGRFVGEFEQGAAAKYK